MFKATEQTLGYFRISRRDCAGLRSAVSEALLFEGTRRYGGHGLDLVTRASTPLLE